MRSDIYFQILFFTLWYKKKVLSLWNFDVWKFKKIYLYWISESLLTTFTATFVCTYICLTCSEIQTSSLIQTLIGLTKLNFKHVITCVWLEFSNKKCIILVTFLKDKFLGILNETSNYKNNNAFFYWIIKENYINVVN